MSRKKKPKKAMDTNSWLGTYADTITLLLTFFVLLYAFSNVDATKFKSVAVALQNVLMGTSSNQLLDLNVSGGEVPVVGNTEKFDDVGENSGENVEATVEGLKNYIQEHDMQDYIDIKTDARGYLFEIKDKILFETGKADLRKESFPILEFIVKYVKTIDNEIIVEGHTDNVPISNDRYEDNYALSADRANNVTRYFINKGKVSPRRLKPTGLGEFFPLVKNDTEKNRAKNRRVNILIVTKSTNSKE
ncbi:chemotaxis protein MotB [Hathewaya proteolytica DSM 3090]|uniref:Chemotaxis protein MotB n=1 Tax=Hathewaya proteolytica DSM 3090 TaxID=1121331 RepID=A0A1M6L9T8_9CLOT|nr:OmpA family protein [Hathewaya proteolytica]SHJ67971.1 chemotaxis protein MotB [Hathewaya proteolytica DSM 3090]